MGSAESVAEAVSSCTQTFAGTVVSMSDCLTVSQRQFPRIPQLSKEEIRPPWALAQAVPRLQQVSVYLPTLLHSFRSMYLAREALLHSCTCAALGLGREESEWKAKPATCCGLITCFCGIDAWNVAAFLE